MFRNLYRLGMLVYLPLLALAVVFYLERTAFIDVAFIFFKVLLTGNMAIQGHRFGSAVTQVIPWVGGKLGICLNGLMIAYSVWAVLYHFICYLLCGSVFRNYKMALVLLLSTVVFVADSFYWIQSELPQGLPFMAVVLAWISSDQFRQRTVLSYGLLVAWLFFYGSRAKVWTGGTLYLSWRVCCWLSWPKCFCFLPVTIVRHWVMPVAQ